MKFLADMGISPRTVSYLRRFGHNAVHLHEEHLDTLADSKIMHKAKNEGRIILTHDLDFGDLLAASGQALPSVIIFRLQNMRPSNVNRYLQAILRQHEDALEQGTIISVTERNARVRRLPINR